jgi:hypothetical protein
MGRCRTTVEQSANHTALHDPGRYTCSVWVSGIAFELTPPAFNDIIDAFALTRRRSCTDLSEFPGVSNP